MNNIQINNETNLKHCKIDSVNLVSDQSMVNSNLIKLLLDSLDKQKINQDSEQLNEMANKLLNQSGQESDLVKDLVNDLVANLKNKDDLNIGDLSAANSQSDSDHDDEQDKDSINNDVLNKHHNGRNSISSSSGGTSSTEERSDDEDDEMQPNVEHERIQEYLNRKDTAVVYPVDVSNLTNETNQTTLNDLPLNKLTNNSLLNATDQQTIKRKKNCKYKPYLRTCSIILI